VGDAGSAAHMDTTTERGVLAMSDVFITADPHLFHPLVAELRGFASVAEHNEAICQGITERVGVRDQLWILGDIALGRWEEALDLLGTLAGTKHLIAGNHDKVHPMHRNAHRFQRRYLDVFESVSPFARRAVAGRRVLMSHFPYRGDHTAIERDMQYRLPDMGEWLLHGHTHSDQKLSGRQVHVGVDAWALAPVTLGEIGTLITTR